MMKLQRCKWLLIFVVLSISLPPLRLGAETVTYTLGTPYNTVRIPTNGNPINYPTGYIKVNGVDVGTGGGSANTILNGTGVPGAGLGNDGDFYVRNDVTPRDLYGPKTAGAWGTATSMGGPAGPTGSAGAAGQGVPTGGSTGQGLKKNSATNYDTSWTDFLIPTSHISFNQVDGTIDPTTQIPTTFINPAYVTVTQSGGTLTYACDNKKHTQNNTTTLTANVTTFTMTSLFSGATGNWIFKQDATGGRTIVLPTTSKVVEGGAGAITITTTANAISVLSWTYDGTNIFWTYGKNFN